MVKEFAASSTFRDIAVELLGKGLGFRFQAKGLSMAPAIQDGDILHIEPAKMYGLKRGDIILFRSGKQLKAHRILARRGPSFITRGDTGMRPDVDIAYEEILGRVVAKQCRSTGATITLTGASFRLRFRVEEFKRSLARAIVKLGVL